MHRTPDVDRLKSAAKEYHKMMLTTFPKVTLRIYEHVLLCHVPDVLVEGSLLDGSSWFLEAYNKLWKHQLLYHSNSGGGVNKDSTVAVNEKRSEKGCARLQAEQGAREALTALKAMWACSHPEVRDYAVQWGQLTCRKGWRKQCRGRLLASTRLVLHAQGTTGPS
jgi:hypothetical protein